MYRIKRTKTVPAVPGGPAPVPAVHYAVAVAKRGNVTAWTKDRTAAGTFADGVVAKVKAYYAGRENVGTLTVEPLAEPAPVGQPASPPAAVAIVQSPPEVKPPPSAAPVSSTPAVKLPEKPEQDRGRKAIK